MSKFMTIFITIASILLIAFLCWHYFFSIYEVRFSTNFDGNVIVTKKKYKISCVGINSFGWEINFRDLDFNYQFHSGKENVKIDEQNQKNTLVFLPISKGTMEIELSSKYALNPSVFNLRIIE